MGADDGGGGEGGGGLGPGGEGGGGLGLGGEGRGGGGEGEGGGGDGGGGGGLGLGGGGEGGGGDEGERYETTAVMCGCSVTGALPSRPSRTQSKYGLCAAESCTVIWLLALRKPPLLLGPDAGHEDDDAGMKKR